MNKRTGGLTSQVLQPMVQPKMRRSQSVYSERGSQKEGLTLREPKGGLSTRTDASTVRAPRYLWVDYSGGRMQTPFPLRELGVDSIARRRHHHRGVTNNNAEHYASTQHLDFLQELTGAVRGLVRFFAKCL